MRLAHLVQLYPVAVAVRQSATQAGAQLTHLHQLEQAFHGCHHFSLRRAKKSHGSINAFSQIQGESHVFIHPVTTLVFT